LSGVRPIICIFPHSARKEPIFRNGPDALRRWLTGELREREGLYYIRCRESKPSRRNLPFPLPKHIPAGSIVLFRIKGETIGEALVKEEARRTTTEERRELKVKEGYPYEALIKFDPESVKIYPKPLTDLDLFNMLGNCVPYNMYRVLKPQQYKEIMRRIGALN